MRWVRLGDVADVWPGVSRHGRGAGTRVGESVVRVLSGGDIDDDRVDPDAGEEARLLVDALSQRYLVEPGDLLVTARATTPRTTLAPEGNVPVMADATLLIVRPKAGIDPAYLWWALTTPWGRDAVQGRMAGATILQLRAAELADVKLPLPPQDEQRRVGALAEAAARTYRLSIEAAALRRRLASEALTARILGDEERGEGGAA